MGVTSGLPLIECNLIEFCKHLQPINQSPKKSISVRSHNPKLPAYISHFQLKIATVCG